MSEFFGMYVVFFFEERSAMKLFLKTRDIELSSDRKLIQAYAGIEITANYIVTDTEINYPYMVVYSLCDIEPLVLRTTGEERVDSAS